MVIINIEGGFGNQLFSYAFGYAQARRSGSSLWIDTSLQDNGLSRKLEIDKLKITFDRRISYPIKQDFISRGFTNKIIKKLSIGMGTRIIKERTPFAFDTSVLNTSKIKIYYSGNWQNYRYFDDYKEELKELLQPKIKFSAGYNEFYRKVKMNNTVSIHIRRGDYVQIGCTIDENYYYDAIDIIKYKIPHARFFVFTDDKEFASELMNKTNSSHEIVEYSQSNPTLEDFYLMTNCSHHIIANSSYSWWAAYLGAPNSQIIAPVTGIWKNEFYPNGWEKIVLN